MNRVTIDVFRRTPLSPNEQHLASWSEGRDVRVIFSHVFPHEDEEWFEPFDTASIGVEQPLPDGRIACYFIDVNTDFGTPERWEHFELLARAGLERVIEETMEAGG